MFCGSRSLAPQRVKQNRVDEGPGDYFRGRQLCVITCQCFHLTPRRNLTGRTKMLISFSTLVLASQLFVTVADDVPKFDIARGCRADNTNTSGLSVGLDESTKGCIHDEQAARDHLQAQWSQFAPSDRAMCTANETDVSSAPPSYVDLLTCLQGQQIAKKMLKN